ncbi:hypothetical protein [Acetonema longum]|uniref:Uncharacterized protein n=1 Tax=Acetonema longum DSM 6540 TaxID=1009370 RepID=F7NI38_9FIRM|nr:hypothetical protein [Acetonema longum]EGO64270.1 hypothetical protein ALO_08680 [Acetonema longum DSM 6540]
MDALTSKEQAMVELTALTYEFLLISRKLSLTEDVSDLSADAFPSLLGGALTSEIETRICQTNGIDAITGALHTLYDRLNELEERVRLSDH